MSKKITRSCVNHIIFAGKKLAWLSLSVCLLLNLLCLSPAQAAEILRETIPLERNEIPLHLERYIEQDGKIKRPILFVHGVTFSSHEFDVDYKDYSLARYFAKHGFEVWLLDIAGFGNSGSVKDGFMPDSDYASEDIASAVRCILERNNISSMDILGWSWGTVTSGRFAAKHPEMVRRLVLYAPIVAGLGAQDVTEPFHKNTWDSAASDFQRKTDGNIDFDIVEKPVASIFIDNAWHYDSDTSPNGGRRDLLVDKSVRLIPTKSIKAPVLIIVGSKDPYVSPDLCDEAYRTLSNKKDSELVIVDGASHAMLMERPYYKLFRERVFYFLSKKLMCDMYAFFSRVDGGKCDHIRQEAAVYKILHNKKPIQQTRRGCLYGSNLFSNTRLLPRFAQICLDMQGFPSCCRGNNLFLSVKRGCCTLQLRTAAPYSFTGRHEYQADGKVRSPRWGELEKVGYSVVIAA